MALTRASKKKKVQVLAKELETSTTAIIGTFAKLTVAQDFELRKVVRGAGGKYRVLKNKLAAKASEGTKVEAALKGLKGVSAAAFTSGDPVELAKAFSKWVSDNAEFTFKLGIIDGKLITVDEVKALATMPAKEELYAKLLFLISSPAQRLVTVLNATGRDLAVVVNEAVKAEKFAGASVSVAVAPVAKAEAPAEEKVAEKAEAAPAEVAPAAPAVEAVTEPETQAEAAATEAPVEGAVVADEPAVIEVPEAETQAEAAVNEAPVEGAVVPDEPAS
jgi:large subunit ribosomal protein L10